MHSARSQVPVWSNSRCILISDGSISKITHCDGRSPRAHYGGNSHLTPSSPESNTVPLSTPPPSASRFTRLTVHANLSGCERNATLHVQQTPNPIKTPGQWMDFLTELPSGHSPQAILHGGNGPVGHHPHLCQARSPTRGARGAWVANRPFFPRAANGVRKQPFWEQCKCLCVTPRCALELPELHVHFAVHPPDPHLSPVRAPLPSQSFLIGFSS